MFNKSLLAVAVLSIATGLAACGGGGGSSSSAPQKPTNPSNPPATEDVDLTGQFLDSAVEGLRYVGSKGSSGFTNDDGEFNYISGEVIRFYIGEKTLLGTAAGQDTVTPASLLESISVETDRKTNILRLLQTVDADGDPSNGIEIPTIVSENLDAANINLDANIDDFEASAGVQSLLTAISKTELVEADQAEAHFQGTLKGAKQDVKPGFVEGSAWLMQSQSSSCAEEEVYTVLFQGDQVVIEGTLVEHKQLNPGEEIPVYGCVTNSVDLTVSVSEWSQGFCSLSDCNSYAALNDSREDSDSDGRLYMSWEPGTPVMRTVRYRNENGHFNGNKRVEKLTQLVKQGDTFAEPTVDVTGTWNVITTDSRCPDVQAVSEFTFTKDLITGFSEDTNYSKETGACSIATEELSIAYADAPDFLAEGPVYALSELNREYPDPDGQGDRVFVSYNQKTDIIVRVKDAGSHFSTITFSRAK